MVRQNFLFYLSIWNLQAHCCSGFLVRDGRRKVRRVFKIWKLMDVSAWGSCPLELDHDISDCWNTLQITCRPGRLLKCHLDIFSSVSLCFHLSLSFSHSPWFHSLSPHTSRPGSSIEMLSNPPIYLLLSLILCILATTLPAESLAWPG